MGLIATLSVPSPAGLYAGARQLGGASTAVLPSSAELTFAGLIGLPATAAGQLRLDRPLVGAVVGPEAPAAPGGERSLSLVVACQVQSGAELALALSAAVPGSPPTRDPATGLMLFARGEAPSLGVLGSWLIVSRDVRALGSAGPFVARVLGARPVPAEALTLEVDAKALHGALPDELSRAWGTARKVLGLLAQQAQPAQGRPPDLGDPELILRGADAKVGTLLALLAASDRLALTATLGDARLELALDVEPTPGGVAEKETSGLTTGPATPLLELPAGVRLAALARIPEQELDAIAPGLGGTITVGVLPDETAILRTRVRDSVAVEHGLPDAVRALRTSVEHGPAKALLGTIRPSDRVVRLPLVGAPAHELTLVPRHGHDAGLSAFWTVRGGVFTGLMKAPAPPTLAQEPLLAAMVGRRMPASLCIFGDLAALRKGATPAPVVFACGRREKRARAELELSAAAVAALFGGWRQP